MSRDIYERAMKQWGERSQVTAAIEELCEAASALTRHLNRKTTTPYDVATELADAEIMLEQMRLYFPESLIEAEKRRKISRLAERLNDDAYQKAVRDGTPDQTL